MTFPYKPTDVEILLERARVPVISVGRVGLSRRRGKLHIRREFSYGRDDEHKATLCGQPYTINFTPARDLDDVSEIDCRDCRDIAGLGPIKPRKS